MSEWDREQAKKAREASWRQMEPMAQALAVRIATENPRLPAEEIVDAAWKVTAAHYRRLWRWVDTGE
jgi:hypothetical protein